MNDTTPTPAQIDALRTIDEYPLHLDGREARGATVYGAPVGYLVRGGVRQGTIDALVRYGLATPTQRRTRVKVSRLGGFVLRGAVGS